MSDSIYYSSNKLFSHQSPFNFVMGERGNGKSYDAKKRMIKNFLNKGEQSIYIRRRRTDIDEVKEFFFDDIKEEFPDDEFMIKGSIGYINGEIAIHFVALSTSLKKKSSPFPKVTLLVFDEYIEPSFKFPNYLKNDMYFLLELISTVVRKRDNWKLILIGNSISYVNPFFSYYDIRITDNDKQFHRVMKDEETGHYLITVELTETPEYREEFSKTNLAKLTRGTAYGDYSMSGKAYEDRSDFIQPERSGLYLYMATILYKGQMLGIWMQGSDQIYIDEKVDKSCTYKYSILDEDLREGFVSAKSENKSWRLKNIKKGYHEGKVFFSTQEVKKTMQTAMRYF